MWLSLSRIRGGVRCAAGHRACRRCVVEMILLESPHLCGDGCSKVRPSRHLGASGVLVNVLTWFAGGYWIDLDPDPGPLGFPYNVVARFRHRRASALTFTGSTRRFDRYALVAQRIEHLTTDQKAGGSNPSERANRSPGQTRQ